GLPFTSTETPARVVGAGEPEACWVARPRPVPRIDNAEPGATGPADRLAAFTTPLLFITGFPPDPILATYPSPVPRNVVEKAPGVAGKSTEKVSPIITRPPAQFNAT